MSTSETARKIEEGLFCESKLKPREVDLDEEDSDFECYDKSDDKPVHVDVDKEVNERDPTNTLVPNGSEEDEMDKNVETRCGIGNISVRRSNEKFKPPERLGNLTYF